MRKIRILVVTSIVIIAVFSTISVYDYETAEYTVTFAGQGYESSGNWSVNLSGVQHYAHDGNVLFKLHRGTYGFLIFHNQTYPNSFTRKVIIATPHNSTLILENDTSILVTFSLVNVSGVGGSIGQFNVTVNSTNVYGSYNSIPLIQSVILPIAVLLVIAISAVIFLRRNRIKGFR